MKKKSGGLPAAATSKVCKKNYEKPLWFKTKERQSEQLTWMRSDAHEVIADECKAVQNDAGIIDISGSSKFIISGEGANDFLNYLSCNKLPQEKGSIGLALFHSSNGGIMTEQSITKIDDEKLEFWWLGTKTVPWSDVKSIIRNSNGGLLVSLMHSLRIEKTDGKVANLPAGCFVSKSDILKKIEEKTGMSVA